LYRKPSLNILKILLGLDKLEKINQQDDDFEFISKISNYIDCSNSMFIGDAAARSENKTLKIKKDFSDSDLKFAYNLGCQFYSPEQFFLKDFTRKVPTYSELVKTQNENY